MLVSVAALAVRITDQGGSLRIIPTPIMPALEAKLAGLQSPRGWGIFLIRQLVDELHETRDAALHTVELVLSLSGDEDAGATA